MIDTSNWDYSEEPRDRSLAAEEREIAEAQRREMEDDD